MVSGALWGKAESLAVLYEMGEWDAVLERSSEVLAVGRENLDVAIRTTLREMIDLLVERHKLSREDAYLLASDAADFSITQLVDGKKGVHGMIAKSIFKKR